METLTTREEVGVGKAPNQLAAQMIAAVKAATEWKKVGSMAVGKIHQGVVRLEKKGANTISVVRKDYRGCETGRASFSYNGTVFGVKYKEVMGC